MRILVTGAEGLLGKELSRLGLEEGYELLATDRQDLDITDRKQVEQVIGSYEPDVIYNCAVIGPLHSEKDPELAYGVNVQGVMNLLQCCAGRELIQFSSPSVFDGHRSLENVPQYARSDTIGYKEDDAVSAISVYGKTKIEAERLLNNTALIVRTSWLCTRNNPFGLYDGGIYPANDIGRPTLCEDVWRGTQLCLQKGGRGIIHICGPEVMSRHEQAGRLELSPAPAILSCPSIRPLAIAKFSSLFYGGRSRTVKVHGNGTD